MSASRAHRAEAAFAAAVMLVAAGLFLVQLAPLASADSAPTTAIITQGGRVVQSLDLSSVKAPYELRFEGDHGFNVVRVEPGRIRIAEADCPDKVCVHAGWIDAPGKPIACVPHELTITVENVATDGKEAGDGIDAVTR